MDTQGGSDELSYPLFVIASGLHRANKKDLVKCTMCPYSLCAECVEVVSSEAQGCHGDKIFRQVPLKCFNECGEVIDDVLIKDKKVIFLWHVCYCIEPCMFVCSM